MKAICALRSFGIVTVLALSVGGCFERVMNPPNHEPTAYQDSVCKHVPSSKQIVNYGCVAGTELSLGD